MLELSGAGMNIFSLLLLVYHSFLSLSSKRRRRGGAGVEPAVWATLWPSQSKTAYQPVPPLFCQQASNKGNNSPAQSSTQAHQCHLNLGTCSYLGRPAPVSIII